jgi:hypothetical protein
MMQPLSDMNDNTNGAENSEILLALYATAYDRSLHVAQSTKRLVFSELHFLVTSFARL